MSDGSVVEVTDRDGWRKSFPLLKAIVYIGSDPRSDIVLEAARGGGVGRRHLQLISVGSGAGYRLINMGETEVRLGANRETGLAPRAFVELSPGTQVFVGDFTLNFAGEPQAASASAAGSTNSRSIGLSLNLPQTQLGPAQPLAGSVVVLNQGDKTGAQFKMEIDGLDPACLEIGPGPILFPNAEKEVFFRVQHPRAARPPAGDYRLRIRATAPAAYPGESAFVSQMIQILPYYSHKVRVLAG